MPRRSATARGKSPCRYKRDFELCKVVFGAVISQILFARRAFPPGYFQLLPVEQVVSRSFEDILSSGSSIPHHDKELLRDSGSTIFLRQGTDYGVNRFLGILREDIFPLLENERLVNFRINYLRTKAWGQNCLREFYTVAFKYERDGNYGLTVWRAGTGEHHASKTESRLWDLGDYLSRLSSWKEPMHWTLAFHARGRPDDPPIGVWKFDHMDFDNANLDLKQGDGYTYARITSLKIMSLPLNHAEQVVSRDSSQPQAGSSAPEKQQVVSGSAEALRQAAKNQRRTRSSATRNRAMHSASRHRASREAQLSPPPTLPSNRRTSKIVSGEKADAGETAVTQHADHEVQLPQTAEGVYSPVSGKKPTRKRKPKRPLQIFENVTSSLSATQAIESQPLSQSGNRQENRSPEKAASGELMQLHGHQSGVPRSPSPDQSRLLDGILLSSDAISMTKSSPSMDVHWFLNPPPSNQQQHLDQGAPMDGLTGAFPSAPPRSAPGHSRGMRQWEAQGSAPAAANLLNIDLSDEDEDTDITVEAETENPHALQSAGSMDTGTAYCFSPDTVGRRAALLQDIPGSSDDDE